MLEELGLLLLEELGLLLEELPDDELPAPETPSAESVCESRLPVALMPCCCWNCFTAARVFGPILPSAATLMPFSLNACCASRTVEAAELPDELDEPLLPLSIDDGLLLPIEEPLLLLPIEEPLLLLLIEEPLLLPIDDVPWANTAPLERISAARVILRRSM